MRPVYAISGGVSKFAKARPDKTFQAIIKEAYDYAIADIGLDFPTFTRVVDGSVASYFSDHFTRQLMAGIMAQDYLGLCPKPGHRVEGGGATGGLCFQEAWKSVASGHMDVCVAYGFETMSHVETWKGNEFIALASDVSFDYPVGGFYSGYYAMMVTRHMKEFGTTVEQMAHVSVKNYINAFHNPYAQKSQRITHPGCAQLADGGLAADPARHLRDVRRRGGDDPLLGRGLEETGSRRREDRAAAGEGDRHRPRHGHDAHGRPSARGLRHLHARLRHRAGEILGRDEGVLQKTLGSRHALSRRPFVPRGTHGGQHGLETCRHQRSVERTGLRRTARRVHLIRNSDLRRPGIVPLRRRRSVRGIGQGLPAEHRLRLEAEGQAGLRGESLGRTDRLRTSCRRDGTDAGLCSPSGSCRGRSKNISATTSCRSRMRSGARSIPMPARAPTSPSPFWKGRVKSWPSYLHNAKKRWAATSSTASRSRSAPTRRRWQFLKKMAPIQIEQEYKITYLHSYGQDSPWFAGLTNKRLLASRDPQSGYTTANPRGHDMYSGAETKWIDITNVPAQGACLHRLLLRLGGVPARDARSCWR